MAKFADKYFLASPWHVIEQGISEMHNRTAESVFSLGNEYMGVRGYFDEGICGDSLQGSYFNGIYEIDNNVAPSYKGIVTKTHFMVNAVNWLAASIELDGEKLCIGQSRIEGFERTLNMYEGTLERRFIWETGSGKRLRLKFTRFVSMCSCTSAYQRIELEPLNFSGTVYVEFGADFGVIHESMQKCFWNECLKGTNGGFAGIVGQTLSSGQRVFAGFGLKCGAQAACEDIDDKLYIGKKLSIALEQNKTVAADKSVTCIADPDARKTPRELFNEGIVMLRSQESFDEALKAHKTFWENRWEHSDIVIEGEDQIENQQGVRFAIFQLTQTYHGDSNKHNIGAKGLTGEFYNGHAFWDTESYCLPYYLFTDPTAARFLLEYRYNTLEQAKQRARMIDCRGACYPVATLNGEEACTLWQHANLQFQADTAIAYAIEHYVKVTGDTEFLYDRGAVMLVEICRFLDSRGAYGQKTGEFGFYGVTGPDEFHMMVSNDCYMNYMAKAAFNYTLDVLKAVHASEPEIYEKLTQSTQLDECEPERWQLHASKMRIPIDEKSGIYEQHDGFFDLPHMEIGRIPVEDFPLYHKWSYDRIYRSDMIKQSAVLLLFLLHSSKFDFTTKKINYEFYEPRTIHESSLSPSVSSILACELGKTDDAMRLFKYATRLDLDNYNRNTREGLHTTSLAAAWLNIVYGFGGMRSDDDVISFAPMLPPGWDGYSLKLNIRGSRLNVSVGKEGPVFRVEEGPPVEIDIYGKRCTIGEAPQSFEFENIQRHVEAL